MSSSKQNVTLTASILKVFLEQEASLIEKIADFLGPFRGQKNLIRALLSCAGQNSDLAYNTLLDGLLWKCDILHNISPGDWISFVPEAEDFLSLTSPLYLYLLVASDSPVNVVLNDLANKEEKSELTPFTFRANRHLYLLPKIDSNNVQLYVCAEAVPALKGMFYLLRTSPLN